MQGTREARLQLPWEGHLLLRADRRAAGGVHILWASVLPEAEAHGAGQDARESPRAARGAHAPADRGALARRRPAPGGDGTRLSYRIWR